MAVNYETGVASTPADLLTKLITFLTGLGWTAQVPLSGDIVLSRGTIFAGIDATTTGWDTRGCLSFDGGLAWNAQPNNSGVSQNTLWTAGPYTAYHFFAGDEGGRYYAHVTVEISAGSFKHWVLGELVKSGTYTGGTYVDSVRADTNSLTMNTSNSSGHRSICDANNTGSETGHIWIDYDSKVNNWAILRAADENDQEDAACGSYRNEGIYVPFWTIGDQGWNLRTPLFPAMYFANRAAGLRSPIGRIPNFRFIHLRNLTPGELVTYGGQTWQVFPMLIRYDTTPSDGNVSSGHYGYAHLRP